MALLLHPRTERADATECWKEAAATSRERWMSALRFVLLVCLLVTPRPLAGQNGSAPGVPAGVGGGAETAAISAAIGSLRADLARLVDSPGWNGDRWTVSVVSLTRGDTLFDRDPDAFLAPASNMKLFTTAAALYYLGADFRYNTFLLTDGTIENGALAGNVVLYGTGDPTLSDRFGGKLNVWEAFADTLAALGVTEVRGDVIGDGTYFRGPGTGTGWQDGYRDATYAAPAAALSFAENIVLLQIRPGAQAGWRPEVEALPGGADLGVVNQATTVAGGRTSIRVTRAAYDGPILVQGQIGVRARPVLRSVPASDPPRFAAAAFRGVLEDRGIRVTGEVRSVLLPEASPVTGRSVFAPAFDGQEPLRVLAIHTSPPLLEILDVINKKSHNLMAEQVLRTVGRVALGDGSAESGARATIAMLEREVDEVPAELAIDDGSGLSALNRVSARSMISLLSFMARSPMWQPYWSTLPEAGVSSGLRRMQRTPAERNLRAKTGTINHVSALSGYVRARNDEVLAFAIISNDVPSTWRAKRVEDAIGARLAAFDRPRMADVVATAPPPDSADTTRAAAPPPPPTPEPAATPSGPAREHTIGPGETLDAISKRYGVTVEQLQEANPGLNPRRLIPGRTVRLPGAAATSASPASPPSSAATAEAPASRHTIRPGDTLDGIARRYGTTVKALQDANPGLNPRRLLPGRTIRIPN
jgi:D-alanyl-D-alanine carboxypeptidase/D-alanyl-D-alanine-endopeptidase (penicillin-binding protein 4)